MSLSKRKDVRNLAIIAHVDHGKTTLLDGLLHVAGIFRQGEVVAERALDSNDLERERGITIVSKCTAITWGRTRINLVDTPGHADFGGEVERVLGMVDSVLLLVDAFEGPMPQTRFVTQKALELGLRPIVVINKIDREGCDPDGALNGVFDLFDALGATDEQLDFPVIYASGREGYAIRELADKRDGMAPLLDLIVESAPPPEVEADAPLVMQVATLIYDEYLGYLAVGRVKAGSCKVGERVLLAGPAQAREEFRIQKILGFQGLRRFELGEAKAGDILAIAGMQALRVGQTITSIASPTMLPMLTIDEPTITMDFIANDSPFSGREGKLVTSRNLHDRLFREVRSNISLRVEETEDANRLQVSGRGELHLSILIETMRREGYEMCVSQPRVIFKENKQEPYEDVVIDVEEAYSGAVIEELNRRAGQLQGMDPQGDGRVRINYRMPARGLIGYRSQFMTSTRGTGVIFHQHAGYGPFAGPIRGRISGVLIAQDQGTTNAYGLYYLQDRGSFLLGVGVNVYGGMIVGIHTRESDLIVNPCKAKKLSNVRSSGADEKLILTPPRVLSLEAALEFINPDELVEVTPKSLRIRKRLLDHNVRKRHEKSRLGETATA